MESQKKSAFKFKHIGTVMEMITLMETIKTWICMSIPSDYHPSKIVPLFKQLCFHQFYSFSSLTDLVLIYMLIFHVRKKLPGDPEWHTTMLITEWLLFFTPVQSWKYVMHLHRKENKRICHLINQFGVALPKYQFWADNSVIHNNRNYWRIYKPYDNCQCYMTVPLSDHSSWLYHPRNMREMCENHQVLSSAV